MFFYMKLMREIYTGGIYMEQNNTGENYLSSVKNALRILNSFTMDEPEKKVSDISIFIRIK